MRAAEVFDETPDVEQAVGFPRLGVEARTPAPPRLLPGRSPLQQSEDGGFFLAEAGRLPAGDADLEATDGAVTLQLLPHLAQVGVRVQPALGMRRSFPFELPVVPNTWAATTSGWM